MMMKMQAFVWTAALTVVGAGGSQAAVLIDVGDVTIQPGLLSPVSGSVDVTLTVTDDPITVGSFNAAFNLEADRLSAGGVRFTGASQGDLALTGNGDFTVGSAGSVAELTARDAADSDERVGVGSIRFFTLEFEVDPLTLGQFDVVPVAFFTQIASTSGGTLNTANGLGLTGGTITVVPEPAGAAAVGAGLLLLSRRRRPAA